VFFTDSASTANLAINVGGGTGQWFWLAGGTLTTVGTGTNFFTFGDSNTAAPAYLYAQPLTGKDLANARKWEKLQRRSERKARRLFQVIFGFPRFERVARCGYFELRGHSGTLYRIGLRGGMDVLAELDKTGLCVFVEGVGSWDRLIALALLVSSGEQGEKKLLEFANKRAAFNLGDREAA